MICYNTICNQIIGNKKITTQVFLRLSSYPRFRNTLIFECKIIYFLMENTTFPFQKSTQL